jgi:hypothetical protein
VDDPTLSWRAIVLYGLNTATYKIALGRSLEYLARAGRDRVTMPELAEVFFDLYAERLQEGNRPQLSHPNRLTVMERVVALHEAGKIDRDEAIACVAADAFGDVVPRFHTVGDTAVPVRFNDATPDGLVLTDATFQLFVQPEGDALGSELGARWDLPSSSSVRGANWPTTSAWSTSSRGIPAAR